MQLLCLPVAVWYYGSFPDKHFFYKFTFLQVRIQLCIAFVLGSIRMKFDFKQIVRYVSHVHISTHMNVVWSSGSYDNSHMYRT